MPFNDVFQLVLDHAACASKTSVEKVTVALNSWVAERQERQTARHIQHTAYLEAHENPRERREADYATYLEEMTTLKDELVRTGSAASRRAFVAHERPMLDPASEVYTQY